MPSYDLQTGARCQVSDRELDRREGGEVRGDMDVGRVRMGVMALVIGNMKVACRLLPCAWQLVCIGSRLFLLLEAGSHQPSRGENMRMSET